MKSIIHLLAALAVSLLLALSTQAQGHDDHLPQTDGVIKKLDPAAGKVAIAHGHIANLDMPPMTMVFKAKTPGLLKPWKTGDRIRFRAAEVKGVLTVVSIDKAE